jgi:outer membrane protein assembly factor BamB
MIRQMLLLILLVLCPVGSAVAEDWPQWRGPDRTGVSKEKGLLESWPPQGPKLLWTFREADAGYSCMCVVGDRLYSMGFKGHTDAAGFTGDEEYVYAVDLKTQKKLWSTKVGPSLPAVGARYGSHGTPTIDGDFLYAVGNDGNLICVETATGRKVWTQKMRTSLGGKQPSYGYAESPLVDGNLVIATPGGKEGVLAAFDKKTGALKWRSTTCAGDAPYTSIIAMEVGGVRQYVQGVGDVSRVVGVRASDGQLLWEFKLGVLVGTPICGDDCVCASSGVGCKLVKIKPEGDKFKAEEIYANGALKNHIGGVILVDGYLYGYTVGRGVGYTIGVGITCQDFKTGKAVWNKKGGGSGSLTFADGNLYCFHDNGEMLLIKATPNGCKVRGKLRIPEKSKILVPGGGSTYTSPVVANGKLYVRDLDLIFCYDISKPSERKELNR